MRYVNAYYENGSFYIITHALSNKIKHIKENPVVAIAGQWFTAHGRGVSLGYFGKRNCVIAETTTEPVPHMACTMVYGDFANIKGAYLAFAEWLQKNSEYKCLTPCVKSLHRGPWNEKNPEKYLIELQIPLEHHTHIEFGMPAKMQGIFPSCISHDVRSYTGFTNKARRKKYDLSVKSHWQSKNDESGTLIPAGPREYIPGLQALEGFSHIQVLWWFSDCTRQPCGYIHPP